MKTWRRGISRFIAEGLCDCCLSTCQKVNSNPPVRYFFFSSLLQGEKWWWGMMQKRGGRGDMISEANHGGKKGKWGDLFEEVAGVIGLLPAICIGSLLHTFGVIVIGTVTATPCCLLWWWSWSAGIPGKAGMQ